jgi:predicted nuclease with TOPRIM domain
MEAMQKDNNALKRETEYLRCQCENVPAIKEQLKTVTAEQQHLKKVRDALQLEVEHLQGQYKDIAAMTEQRDKCQARDTKAVEKARDALKLQTNDLQSQCEDAAALKEQLNIATEQCPKLRKGRVLVVLVTMLILCISVGLLWMQSDLLNTYVMPVAPSHKCISATTAPFCNIVV